MRKDTNTHSSQEPEVFPGPSNQGQMRVQSTQRGEQSRKQEPLQRTRRTTGGAEEYGDRQPTTEQPRENEPQYGSGRRKSGI
ncbi:hypothetical protein TNCV_2584951 [Trichonephila clavipes]|nr:hypothetical protein TNCV_2584951 [Trichonephila clavipes]